MESKYIVTVVGPETVETEYSADTMSEVTAEALDHKPYLIGRGINLDDILFCVSVYSHRDQDHRASHCFGFADIEVSA